MSSLNNGFDVDKEFKKAEIAADMKRYDLVITLMRGVLRVQPNSAYAFRKLAYAHYWRDEFEAGIEAIENSLRLNADDDYAHALYGQLLYSVNRSDEAEREFEMALSLNPLQVTTHYWYARLIRDYRKDYEKALMHAAKTIELDPENGDNYLLMGVTLERAGKLDESGAYYKTALSLKPESPYALNDYAWYLLECKNEVKEAIELFRQALSYDPNYEGALLNLRYAENKLKETEKQQDEQGELAKAAPTILENVQQPSFAETDLPVAHETSLIEILRPFGKIFGAVMRNLREIS